MSASRSRPSGVAICAAGEHDADARGHDVLAALEDEGAEQRLLDALRDPHRAALRREVLAEHDELVAAEARERELLVAEARQRVGRSQGDLEPVRDGSQELVAGAVSEGVVDVLEAVEIQEQQRGERAVALGARQRELETIAEEQPVRQPRQGVVRRLVSDLLLRADALDHAPELPADLRHHLEQRRGRARQPPR